MRRIKPSPANKWRLTLYRYAEYKGIDVSARADLSTFTDGTTVSPWAQDVVQWAVAEKLMSGNGNELQPKGTASRAQMPPF